MNNLEWRIWYMQETPGSISDPRYAISKILFLLLCPDSNRFI